MEEDEEATSIHQNMNLKKEDFKDTCRVCMDRHEEMNSLFDGKSDSIVDRVQFCTGIQFTKKDGLPTQICNACIQNLTVAHKFKTSCLRSEELFQKILQDNIKEEPDDDFNYLLQYDDNDGDEDGIKVKEEVLENVLNKNLRKTTLRIKKEEIESTVVKEIKQQKQKKGPNKKSSKPKRILRKCKYTRLKCEPCNMKFKTKLESDKHEKLAHKDRSWVCEVCGKIFTSQPSHYSHTKTHLPPRYACEHCDYKTSHKTALANHMRIHTGEKLYQCEICSLRFRISSVLKDHRRRFHERQTRHKCTMCDKRFYDKGRLNRHIDTHSKIKRYECEVCHSCFSRRCYWKKHLHLQHGVVIPAKRPGRRSTINVSLLGVDNSISRK